MGSGLTQTAWQNRIVIRRKSVDLPTTCKQRRVDRVAAELIQQWSKAHLATIRRYNRAKNTDPRSLSTSTTMIMITGPDRNRRHRIDRLCLVSAVTPSHRRSPMAVGKPSFACFSPAIVTVGCVGPTIQQPNDLLTAITRIEATSKMREHLQVVAKECSKPIAKCVQLNTEDQTSLPRALETFIAKTVRGSKTCCVEAVEARSKRYDQADLAMIRQNRRRRRRETELIPPQRGLPFL